SGGRSLWKNASNAAFLRFLAFCWPFAHMFFPALSPDSVDNRIPPLSELIPLAAAERPSAASQ
ncbi:hypothetical protein, partial [Escherichia coli]|uniref:hypothetical protein n=1 Tax=Escherichia coli TaxID=562 RepID=UPI00194EAF23